MSGAGEPQQPWRVSMGKWQPWRISPWCPSPEDGRFLIEATAEALDRSRPSATVLILGVTPETLQLDWPGHADLIAADSSAEMIALDWRPHPRLPSSVVEARWQRLPLCDATAAATVGDASLNALPGFEDYAAVLEEVARVLKPGGVLALRMFLRGERAESCREVVDAAAAGAFPCGVGFRLRFAMAVAGESGILDFAHIPGRFDALVQDRAHLARLAGWSREDLDRIDIYGHNRTRINFPTETELRRLVEPRFALTELRYGHYDQAERCPTAVLLRR